jgi:hypothetical protein
VIGLDRLLERCILVCASRNMLNNSLSRLQSSSTLPHSKPSSSGEKIWRSW